MSTTQCLVRIVDNMLYGTPSPIVTNPDTSKYMEVSAPLGDVGSANTRNYRWNVKESKFYDAGLKDSTGIEPTRVILEPFADKANNFYRGQGFTFTCNASSDTIHEIHIPEERTIDGTSLWLGTPLAGLYAQFKVVDNDGIYAPGGTVLNQFGFDWQVHPTSENIERPGYPATIYAGLYIRIAVTNPTVTPTEIYGRLRLHEHKEST